MAVTSLPHKHLSERGLFVTAVALVGLGRAALGRLPRCKLSSRHAHIPIADHFALVADQNASYQASAATDTTTTTVVAFATAAATAVVSTRGAAAATAAAAAIAVAAAVAVVVVVVVVMVVVVVIIVVVGRTTAAAAVTAASSVVVVSTAAAAASSTNSAAAARHFHTTNPRRAVPSHGAPPDRPSACSGDTTCRLLLLLTPTVDTNTWIAHIIYTYTTKHFVIHTHIHTHRQHALTRTYQVILQISVCTV